VTQTHRRVCVYVKDKFSLLGFFFFFYIKREDRVFFLLILASQYYMVAEVTALLRPQAACPLMILKYPLSPQLAPHEFLTIQ